MQKRPGHDLRWFRSIMRHGNMIYSFRSFWLSRHMFLLLLALAAAFMPRVDAHAGTTVRVIETWPSGDDVVLGRDQNFYLRLAYETDKPIGIWVKPYFRGKPVNVGSNPSQTYSGSGETFGWFFFMKPGDQVDEIRIAAGDGSKSPRPASISSLPGRSPIQRRWWISIGRLR